MTDERQKSAQSIYCYRNVYEHTSALSQAFPAPTLLFSIGSHPLPSDGGIWRVDILIHRAWTTNK